MKPELDKSGDGARYANQSASMGGIGFTPFSLTDNNTTPPALGVPFGTPDDPFGLHSDHLGPQLESAAKPSALDTEVGGTHYKKLGQYQPWQVAAACMSHAELRGYMKGTVIAYLMREADKGGDQDIEKALHTMQLWQEVRKDK